MYVRTYVRIRIRIRIHIRIRVRIRTIKILASFGLTSRGITEKNEGSSVALCLLRSRTVTYVRTYVRT